MVIPHKGMTVLYNKTICILFLIVVCCHFSNIVPLIRTAIPISNKEIKESTKRVVVHVIFTNNWLLIE